MSADSDDIAVTRTRTWLERAVIGLNLCPFAKAVHIKQRIRYVATDATDVGQLEDELARELELMRAAPMIEIETTLLIHPNVLRDFIDYNFFLARADETVKRLGLRGTIQVASFHPQYEFAGSSAEDMGNYTNRSPYPMLHLLREESVDRAVAAIPDSATIVDANIETLRRLGHEGWRRLWLEDGDVIPPAPPSPAPHR